MIRALFSYVRRATTCDRLPRRSSGGQAQRLTVDEVDRILLGLPELERAVYLNHRNGGLSYATIAGRLGITTADVEQIMQQAYHHLICGFREIENERAR